MIWVAIDLAVFLAVIALAAWAAYRIFFTQTVDFDRAEYEDEADYLTRQKYRDD